jgi:NitT/TauT family transport system permease protein
MNASRKALGYLGAIAFLLLTWQLVAMAVDSPALPPPTVAIPTFVDQIPELWQQLLVSTWRVLAAMLLGTVIAVPLGLVVGRSPRLDALMAPIIFVTYPIPKVVFLPVLMILLGLGDLSKVSLIALIIFFQILVTARDAAKAVPEASVVSVRSLGASRGQVFRHVVFPASLPEVFTALRISTGTAVAVLFISESFAGTSGLGWYIVDAWGRIDYPAMFAGIIAMALLGVVLSEALDLVEHRVTRWRRAEGAATR